MMGFVRSRKQKVFHSNRFSRPWKSSSCDTCTHDAFSKLGNKMAVIGYDFTNGDLNQSGARYSRPFVNKPVAGDVVPIDRYLAYLFTSSFAKSVNSIDNSNLSYQIDIGNDHPMVQQALDKLEVEAKLSILDMKGFKVSVKKLLYADSHNPTRHALRARRWRRCLRCRLRTLTGGEWTGVTGAEWDSGCARCVGLRSVHGWET